ncbi:MAG: hypothetical protein J6I40_07655 [Mailhella sp.]|nr:hypothetical protein [Mailhella sp.]
MEDTLLQQEQEIIIDLTDIMELGQHAGAYMSADQGNESMNLSSAGQSAAEDWPNDPQKGQTAEVMNQESGFSDGQNALEAVQSSLPAEKQEKPSLEHRLAEAEKTIMALCAEVQRLRDQLDRPDFSSEVFLIHAAQATQGLNCSHQYLLPENASAVLDDAVNRVEKLESRMKELEDVSERSAAEAAAHIIREEISAIRQGRQTS